MNEAGAPTPLNVVKHLGGGNGELVCAAVLRGVLERHLGDVCRHRGAVAAAHLGDHRDGLLQGEGTLLQRQQQLLLTLLVGEELLVVADAHADQALAQLITGNRNSEWTEIIIKCSPSKSNDNKYKLRKHRAKLSIHHLHQSARSVGGILHDIVDVLHWLRLCFNLNVCALVHIQVFLQFKSLPTIRMVTNPLLLL